MFTRSCIFTGLLLMNITDVMTFVKKSIRFLSKRLNFSDVFVIYECSNGATTK